MADTIEDVEEDSGLVGHAKRELEMAGLMDKDADYGGMLGSSALDIIRLMASQGHSGHSAAMLTDIVGRLMRYDILTPLTFGPDDWNEVGESMWQHRRKHSVFTNNMSEWYDIDDDGPTVMHPIS